MTSPRELAALFDRYGPLVYRRARRILGSHEDAEEATQEVFIRALASAERFEHRSQVTTWLYRITVNYCLNRLRDRRRRTELWTEHGPSEGGEARRPDQLVLVRTLLAETDEDTAKVVLHVVFEGLTHEEAAKELGVSRRTIGNMLERFNDWARARLEEVKAV